MEVAEQQQKPNSLTIEPRGMSPGDARAKHVLHTRDIVSITSVNYCARPRSGCVKYSLYGVKNGFSPIFDCSELRHTTWYPFQSASIHRPTPTQQIDSTVLILILTLLICAKFQVKCFQRNQQNGCLTKVVEEKLLCSTYYHSSCTCK